MCCEIAEKELHNNILEVELLFCQLQKPKNLTQTRRVFSAPYVFFHIFCHNKMKLVHVNEWYIFAEKNST